ncbi:hypothetical protein ABMY20_12640 [Tenacibaculum sp. SSH1-16]|uniref:hypothetical protein n=1 Tax=Tenacibaculum sp. SSH1-16 TaxID=3136667 RepID=UPI0032C4A1E8
MKTIYRVLTCFYLFILVGCSSQKAPVETTKTETNKITELIIRDTVFEVEKDSSFYKSWIECVNNKPVLKPLETASTPTKETPVKETKKSGKYLKTPDVSLHGNVLEVSCEAEAQRLFFQWKEKFVQEQKTITKTVVLPPVEVPRELTWWQKLWIGHGKTSAFVLLVWLVTKIQWKSLFRLLKSL